VASRGPSQTLARRRRIKEKGYGCEQCGRAGYVELHHITQMSNNGTHDTGNTILLCDGCHRKAHGYKPRRPGVAMWAEA